MRPQVLRVSSIGELADARPAFSAAAVWPPVVVGLAYYLGCLAGFALRYPGSGISFFWPPNAILTASLLLMPARWWPRVLVGAFAAHGIAHSMDGIGVAAWLVMFMGNALQAVLAASVVRRYEGAAGPFADSRRILMFIIGGCWLASGFASLASALTYVSLGWATDFLHAWTTRTVSNAIAMLTIVPSVVLLWPYVRDRRVQSFPRVGEFGALLVGLILVQAAVLPIGNTDLGLFIALYAPMPLLLWGTVRFGVAGLSFALLTTTLLTVLTALNGRGPLSGDTPAETVLAVQLVLAANAIPMMLLAGVLQQRRVAYSALIDVEQQTSAILRALPDQMFVVTRDGTCVRAYPQTEHTGPQHSLLQTGEDIQDVLPPDLAHAFSRTIATVGADEASVLEFPHTLNGELRQFEARFIAIDAERILTVIRDITSRWRSELELRESQQRFALASVAGSIGVWEVRVPEGKVHIEGTLKQLLGYRDTEITDQLADWLSIIAAEDIDMVTSRLNALVAGEARTFDADFRMQHKDGSFRCIASHAGVTETAHGKPSRIIGTYADITERRENQRLLREAHDAVVRLNRIAEVSEVSASIAHEVNQPLTAIAANALTGLRWTEADPAAQRINLLFKDVLEDSQRAAHVIERTHRMFSNEPAESVDVDLNAVARQTLDVVAPRARELRIRVELALAQDLPIVHGDAVQLGQVLMNLIVNAMDATGEDPQQPRRLTISTRRGKRHVVVSVRDNGRGFGDEGATHVFEAFYTTKSAGTGMGLAIARSIVQAHGGRIWAVANVDRGATFRVKLPRLNAHSQGPRRLLVVDDDRGMRRSLARLLQSWGHQVVVASGPTQALAAAETYRPDIAILDLSIGEGTGLDLARTLRERFPGRQWKLYVMTADNDDAIRQECLTVFDGFLLKPTQLSDLQRLLN
jgi:PAS domain S-box-containing protein